MLHQLRCNLTSFNTPNLFMPFRFDYLIEILLLSSLERRLQIQANQKIGLTKYITKIVNLTFTQFLGFFLLWCWALVALIHNPAPLTVMECLLPLIPLKCLIWILSSCSSVVHLFFLFIFVKYEVTLVENQIHYINITPKFSN